MRNLSVELTEKFSGGLGAGGGIAAAAALSPLVFLAPAGFHRGGLSLGGMAA
jgi:hypothetical protein